MRKDDLGEGFATGSHASHEAPAGLRPSGFDPSRWVGDKYSPNLAKWLRKQRSWMQPMVYRDPSGGLYIGTRDELGWFSGCRLYAVLGGTRGGGTVYAHVPSWGSKLEEVTGFWERYSQIGRCAIDTDHTMCFLGEETRWSVDGDYRECRWCGNHRQYHRRCTETVHRDRWEPCDSDTRRMAETGTGSVRSTGSAGLNEASPVTPCKEGNNGK